MRSVWQKALADRGVEPIGETTNCYGVDFGCAADEKNVIRLGCAADEKNVIRAERVTYVRCL